MKSKPIQLQEPIQSLNKPFATDLEIEELESRVQVEFLEERLELGCWIECTGLCIET
jgi:hypothetical protein